jgi:hypothetical protein
MSMTVTPLRLSATTLTLLIAGAATMSSAPKPKPVASVPATMTFRCYSYPSVPADPACEVITNTVAVSADHVGDDGDGRTYTGGVLGSGAAYLKVTGTGRAFRLFLHEALAAEPNKPSRSNECAAPGALAGCNPGPLLPFDGTSALFGEAEVNIKVLNQATLEDASLTAMACTPDVAGTGSLALVHFTFWVPGGEGHWGLNFNSRAYHSTGATIRRVSGTRWVVEATSDQYAELVSFNHSAIQGKKGPSHEGRYTVPFMVTIDTPAGSTTCP